MAAVWHGEVGGGLGGAGVCGDGQSGLDVAAVGGVCWVRGGLRRANGGWGVEGDVARGWATKLW